MPWLGFVRSPVHWQGRKDWEPVKKIHIQDYCYADKTQIDFCKCTDTLSSWKSEFPGSGWTKAWPLSKQWSLPKRIGNSRDANYSPLLIQFITWLSLVFLSLISVDNSNIKFYCICFLFSSFINDVPIILPLTFPFNVFLVSPKIYYYLWKSVVEATTIGAEERWELFFSSNFQQAGQGN